MNIENNVLDLNSVKPLISRLSKLKIFSIPRKWVGVQNQAVICENQINILYLHSILAHIIVYLTLKY